MPSVVDDVLQQTWGADLRQIAVGVDSQIVACPPVLLASFVAVGGGFAEGEPVVAPFLLGAPQGALEKVLQWLVQW